MSQQIIPTSQDSINPQAAQPAVNQPTRKKTYGGKNAARRISKSVAATTSHLRRKKVKKQLDQKADGIEEVLEADSREVSLDLFEDYPVMGMEELEETRMLSAYQAQRAMSPQHDENLQNEFWAHEGAIQGHFMEQLPISNRFTVASMDMVLLRD